MYFKNEIMSYTLTEHKDTFYRKIVFYRYIYKAICKINNKITRR